jgi:hypothetical protein
VTGAIVKGKSDMAKLTTALAAVLALMACKASAQTSPAPGQRPFDLVSGIVFACGSATGFAWTGEACNSLSAEFKKRAEANKLPFTEVLITADFKTKKRDTVNGFNEDKAVRVFWNFVESKEVKGRISAGLSANRIWEPMPKDIPNVAPGQRIPVNFYLQSVLFDPGAMPAQAEPYLTQMTNNFFKYGEAK